MNQVKNHRNFRAAMIPQTNPILEPEDWQQTLKGAIRSPAELLDALGLDMRDFGSLNACASEFPVIAPEPYMARMVRGDINDPLLLQVLPSARELDPMPGYRSDPVGDSGANPVPGLIHKYAGRALLVVSGHCAVNCRYCFRRHFNYGDNRLGKSGWEPALNYLKSDTSIREVIFSGGDPLMLQDHRLGWLINQIEKIAHVQRLRVHTRLPVVIPARVTDELVERLSDHRLSTAIVLHINHPNEIDEQVAAACRKLRSAGIALLNQSVLLKNVNDCGEILVELSEKLWSIGVSPYYLHLLDKVAGAAHFDTDLSQAREIETHLRTQLPGYLVPKLVSENPGEPYKVPLS
ncbi:MAG: EF-P beta-lysylation protein EpmB [bacterium]